MSNQSKIHVIEKYAHFAKLKDGEWESAWWKVTPEIAQQLVGGSLYCHKKKRDKSFFGGIILGFRTEKSGEYQGRIIFRIKFTPEHRNCLAGEGGWQLEKKIVLEKP